MPATTFPARVRYQGVCRRPDATGRGAAAGVRRERLPRFAGFFFPLIGMAPIPLLAPAVSS